MRLYETRHAVTTEYQRSGIPIFEQRYVTGHTLHDILNEYTALDPAAIRASLQKHWDYAAELLVVVQRRAGELGLTEQNNDR